VVALRYLISHFVILGGQRTNETKSDETRKWVRKRLRLILAINTQVYELTDGVQRVARCAIAGRYQKYGHVGHPHAKLFAGVSQCGLGHLLHSNHACAMLLGLLAGGSLYTCVTWIVYCQQHISEELKLLHQHTGIAMATRRTDRSFGFDREQR